jgi:hypothetical protein
MINETTKCLQHSNLDVHFVTYRCNLFLVIYKLARLKSLITQHEITRQ